MGLGDGGWGSGNRDASFWAVWVPFVAKIEDGVAKEAAICSNVAKIV